MWLYLILLISASVANSDTATPPNPDRNVVRKDSSLCGLCTTVAGVAKKYLDAAKQVADALCTVLPEPIGGQCKGLTAMLLAALGFGGENHVCSMLGLCGRNGSSLEVPDILKPLTSEADSLLENFVNITSDVEKILRGSLNQTTARITNLFGSGMDLTKTLSKKFPFFSRSARLLTGYERNNFNKVRADPEKKFDAVFGGNLQQDIRSEMHWFGFSGLKIAERFLSKLETPIPDNATEIEKAIYHLTEGIKEKTLGAIKKKLEAKTTKKLEAKTTKKLETKTTKMETKTTESPIEEEFIEEK